MTSFNWPDLMRAGIQGLQLRPDEFWDLSPAELLLLIGQDQGAAPMNRNGLNALLQEFPDGQRPDEKGTRHE